MKRTRATLCALLAALPLSAPLRAWDSVGHQVVAQIAWANMTPQARSRAAELLKAAPSDADLASLSTHDRELFLLASTWPDIVRDEGFRARREKYHHANWHFTNFFWEQPDPGSPPRDRDDLQPAKENVAERLKVLEERLTDSGRGDADKAVDLAWVLHLAGDIHQPLHTSARVTPTEPEGDRGGNLFTLAEDDSLHWYWDSILQKIWYRRGLSESQMAVKIAEEFQRQLPESSMRERLKPGQYEDWAREGLAKAKAEVYPPSLERGKEPSSAYRWQTYNTAKPAMVLAGYRLAEMLNRLLAGRAR